MLKIGEKIRLAREIKGMSQKALSEKAQLSRQTIINLEQGWFDPKFSTVEKLLTALEIKSFDELDTL